MPRQLKPHGTMAAYRRHIRHGEMACHLCAAAWAEYIRDYKRRARARHTDGVRSTVNTTEKRDHSHD